MHTVPTGIDSGLFRYYYTSENLILFYMLCIVHILCQTDSSKGLVYSNIAKLETSTKDFNMCYRNFHF